MSPGIVICQESFQIKFEDKKKQLKVQKGPTYTYVRVKMFYFYENIKQKRKVKLFKVCFKAFCRERNFHPHLFHFSQTGGWGGGGLSFEK